MIILKNERLTAKICERGAELKRSATLRNRKTGRALRIDFPKAKYFLLWHKPNASYICLEPWDGLPDTVASDGYICNKEGITSLAVHNAIRTRSWCLSEKKGDIK